MLKYLSKEKNKEKELLDISNKLPSNEVVCSQILYILGNNKTDIKIDKDIKNSYYVFLNNTIYLSDKSKNNNNYYRICVIAHECIHSIQSKLIQIFNFVLSNVELIAFVISIICALLKFSTSIVLYTYLGINIVSMIPRLILEIDASIKSIDLVRKYIKDKVSENESNLLIKYYNSKVLVFLPIFVIYLLAGRILRFSCIYLLSK